MSTIYEKIGLRRIVNACGHVTKLGVSTITEETGRTMVAAAQSFVVIDDLIDRVGELIAAHTGGEDACVTSCASAGIMIATAALIAGEDLGLIERMPDSTGLRNEIILQKGHAVNFGAPIEQMIRMGGGIPVLAGQSNQTWAGHIESLIGDRTAALFYCKSHHVQQESTISLGEMIEVAHRHGLPIYVDAAAEEDIRRYIAMGADMVIYSGAKAIESCTSGFITGRRELMRKCKAQYKGVGRAAKIGKEGMMGLVAALDQYDNKDTEADGRRQREITEKLVAELSGLDYLKVSVQQDNAGRQIFRTRLDVIPGKSRYTARQIVEMLENGDPAIYTRNHFLDEGAIMIDPRTMVPGDAELIIRRLKEFN